MSGAIATRSGPIRKDQLRALKAYEWAQRAKMNKHLDDYEIAVQSFAASLLRGGLAVAVSVLERSKDRGGFDQLLADLASYSVPGIASGTKDAWPHKVRSMPSTTNYMQATREFIALATWLQRACRGLGEAGSP